MKGPILSRAIRFEGPGSLTHLSQIGFLFRIKRFQLLLKLPEGAFSAPPISDPEEDLILMLEQFKAII
jgi:hypothetical protein